MISDNNGTSGGGFGPYDGDPVLVPEGMYNVRIIHHGDILAWGRGHKIRIDCQILRGEHKGKVIPMYFNTGNRNGKPFLGHQSKYDRMHVLLTGKHLPRKDQVRKRVFMGKEVEAEVRTVTADGEKRPLAPGSYYSTVNWIYRVLNSDNDISESPIPF